MANRPLIHATNGGVNLAEVGPNGEIKIDVTNLAALGATPDMADELILNDVTSDTPTAMTVAELNAALTLADLSDFTETGVGTGEIVAYTGASYENQTLAEAGIAAATHNQNASTIEAGTFGAGNFVFQGDLTIGTIGELFFDQSERRLGINVETFAQASSSDDVMLQINEFGELRNQQVVSIFGGQSPRFEAISFRNDTNNSLSARIHLAHCQTNQAFQHGNTLGSIQFGAHTNNAAVTDKDDIGFSAAIYAFSEGIWTSTAQAGASLSFNTGIAAQAIGAAAIVGTQRLLIDSVGDITFGDSGAFFDYSQDALTIGSTATPTARLFLASSVSNGYLRCGTVFEIDGSGNVGIGTVSPSSLLEVEGSVAGQLVTLDQNNDGGNFIDFQAAVDAVSSFDKPITTGATGASSGGVVGPSNSAWDQTHMIQIEINGTVYYLAAYELVALCPRIDAWDEETESWVKVGRAIYKKNGYENRGLWIVQFDTPATHFRLVEDEPETSYIDYILSDEPSISGGIEEPFVTTPSTPGQLGKTTEDMFIREFTFDSPVTHIHTHGYYVKETT